MEKKFSFKSLLVMLCMILMGGGSVKAETVDFGPDWNTVFGTSYSGQIEHVTKYSLTLSGNVNNVGLTVTNGPSTNGYVKTSDFRLYNGYTMTFKAPDGYVVTGMTSTKGGKTFSSGISANVGSLSISKNSINWVGSSNEVILSMTGTVSFATITVTIVDENALSTPVLSLPEGEYWTDQTLTVDVPSGVDGVKYTTDGSDPKTYGTTIVSSTPISITETTTVRAIAYKGENYSEEVSRTYTFVPSIANTKETAYTTEKAKDVIKNTSDAQLAAEKVYVKGVVSKVDYYNSTYKSITYWLDNNTFEVYSGKNLNNTDFSAETDIKVGAKVIIYGNIKKFGNGDNAVYEFEKNNYLKEYTAPSNLELVAQQGGYYYATFSLEKDVKFVDAEVYAVNVDGDALKLNAVDSKEVPANTGVLIKTTSTTTSYYEVEANGTISDNMLKASSVAMSDSDKNYKLAYNDYSAKTGLGFYYGAANGGEFTPKTDGAYLAVPSAQTSARCFTFDDVETGINTIEVADEANTATEVYDLAGRKVSKAQKGLYIVNGIKVIK